jgi:N-acetylglucosamine-6-phosphate deacetylase
MVATSVVGGRVVTTGAIAERSLLVEDDTIAALGSRLTYDESAGTIDATGLIVAPGFIDVQVNGGFGIDLGHEPERVWRLGELLPQHGVTAFLPTIISSGPGARQAMVASLLQRPATTFGATPIGVHFEGPMLNVARRGVHPADQLIGPGVDLIAGWTRSREVAMVTLAPELPGALEIIAELVRRGVTVALGHTDANESQTRAAVDVGATAVTHLFNAMAPLRHRDPGLVGVALAGEELVVGLIVDGHHVDPTVVAATWNARGPHGVMLVTDAVAAMGQPPGRFDVAGVPVVAADGAIRDSAGAFAGSVLTMDKAVRNLVEFSRCDVSEALLSASATPARVLRDQRRGALEPGRLADIVMLDDELRVQLTMCSGRVAYVADSALARLDSTLLTTNLVGPEHQPSRKLPWK